MNVTLRVLQMPSNNCTPLVLRSVTPPNANPGHRHHVSPATTDTVYAYFYSDFIAKDNAKLHSNIAGDDGRRLRSWVERLHH